MTRFTNSQIEIMAAHMEEGVLEIAGVQVPVGPSHRENTPIMVMAMKLQREMDTLSGVRQSRQDGHPAQRRYIKMAVEMAGLLGSFAKGAN